MPELNPHDSGRSRARPQLQPSERETQKAPGSGATPDEPQHLSEISLGRDYGQHAFERHAALLGDSRLSRPANARVRMQIAQQLQRDYGNQYVQRLVNHIQQPRVAPVQTKLTVGPADDQYEQEADRVAQQVMGILSSTAREPTVQRQELEEEELQMKPLLRRQELEEDELQTKPLLQRQVGVEGGGVGPAVEESIQQARGQGQPLQENVRSSMESAFGADFSGVRVHTGTESDSLNESVSARAFTTGQDIFFRQGEYGPSSSGGRELLAHELTHVVQQNGVSRDPSISMLEETSAGAQQVAVNRATIPTKERGTGRADTEELTSGATTEEAGESPTDMALEGDMPDTQAATGAPAPPGTPSEVVQTKLTVSHPGDKYEQEADQVAEQVVGMTEAVSQEPNQRQDVEQEDLAQSEPLTQRQVSFDGGDVEPDVEQSIQKASGHGQSLPKSVQASMEGAFGTDFSGVQAHTDSKADALSSSVSARAFTTGQDIFFRQGEYNPSSSGGRELLAHELTHVVQQDGAGVQRQAEGAVAEDPNEPIFEEFKGQSINKIGHISAPAGQYEVAKTSGVNVRAKPHGALPPIEKVIYDTEVLVRALDNTDAFYFIISDTNVVGWINKDFVALDPPFFSSRLHHITESNLTTILKNEYVDKGLWELSTGNDYTTLASAVVQANEGREGVSVDWEVATKFKENNTAKRLLDPWMIDNFAIYAASEIKAGFNIWLPPVDYVRMLQSSGAIGSRPDWVNATVDVGHAISGFYTGVISGIFGAVWDTITGIYELGKGIVNTIKSALDGSLFPVIREIYETVTSMSWEDAEAMVAEIITMGKGAFNGFMEQWDHPDTYKQWNFRGFVIGAIALEVILALISGGASLGVKALAKIGKYLPKLKSVLGKLMSLGNKLRRRRRRGGRDTNEPDRDTKEPETQANESETKPPQDTEQTHEGREQGPGETRPKPLTEFVNNNPKATADEIRIGKELNDTAQSGQLRGVERVEGAAEVPGARSGDYRFIGRDGKATPADLYQPQSGNPSSIQLNIVEKSGQAEIVVVELGRGRSGQIEPAEALKMAQNVINTPGHSVDRVIIIKSGKSIVDVSR